MGAARQIDIHGEKGGETSPKSPIEATDSLRSTNLAKILIAVGEGEFDGTPTAANIYLDNTPIYDASGNVNFPNVKWEWRTGSVDQSYIPGIPSVENETNVNVELRSDAPWVRSITNAQLSAVRVRLAWPALQSQDDEGNVGGYRIEYAIDVATDGGAYQQVLIEAVDGKTTTRYERSRRIDLPNATSGWQIRVRRITPNQNTNKIADTMLVAGLTEVIDAKLRYPNTALLYIEFDAEQFSNIPAVTVDCNGRKWQVPGNYDPVSRSYSGVWDGTFKLAWTNNPAWITFGVCTEDRFGLGKRIKPFMVDKWELYRIAQYCDQLVPDGVGGQEPRFLCDMNLQGKAEAWGLLRDISAIYRGMTYWAQGQLVMQADMPRAQDFDYVFTRANVIDGKFSYGSASAKTRYTRALVSYDNPANNYDTDVVAYSDLDLQRRFNDKPVEITAIGCTRASEAQRRGKWIVLSNNLDRTVAFKTGMEGAIPLPGFIIPIADSLLAGREIGGRISSAGGSTVTLDRDTLAKPGDRLIVNLPSGKAEGRTVQSVTGRAVTLTTAYSEAPIPELQWALDADDLAIPLYRVLTTKRTTEGDYEITALQYEPSKFAYIDTGARLEERPISVIPITVVPAPASVTLTATSAIDQGIAVTTMTIAWPVVPGAVAYDVEWRKDSGNWIKLQRTGNASIEVVGIYSGAYLARVRAVSAFDISSIWRTSILTQLNGKTGTPPSITSLTTTSLLFGIQINWAFPPGAGDTQRTEIWYGPANDLAAATKLADLAYPQSDYSMQQLKAGATLFFWARLVDRSGNIGPFYPVVDGVVGQASSDATAILDQIAGEVTKSALGQELLADIEKIDGNGPGSVNARIEETKAGLEQQVGAVNDAVTDARTELGQQIAGVSQSVTDVRNDLQGQIDSIADLADSMPYKPDQTYIAGQGVLGTDGVIYQATQAVPVGMPPPNTTYWLNVGQAVVSANGLATRMTTAETKITDIEGVNTAQSSTITGLQSALTGKADATAVNSLTTRVTTAEGSITSQGQAITGLTNTVAGKADASALNSLTTRVTSAEGVNTSQGTAITNLTNSVGGKADASAVQALTTRVTATESKNADQDASITSQGQAITALNNTVAGKADASAVQALTTRVTSAEGVNTTQAGQITSLTTSVAGKADSSTVSALSNTVTQQGTDITAQGQALTNVTASIGSVGGENLLYNPSFDIGAATADGWTLGSTGTGTVGSIVSSTLDPAGKAQRIDVTLPSASAYVDLAPAANLEPSVVAGQTVTMSAYVRGTVGTRIHLYFQWRNAAGTIMSSDGPTSVNHTDAWQRVSRTALAPAGTVSARLLYRLIGPGSATSVTGFMEVDRAQFELSPVMSGWRDNTGLTDSAVTAAAAATAALTVRVAQTETGLTSTSADIVTLANNLSSAGGENLLYNPSFDKVSDSDPGLGEGWSAGASGGAVGLATRALVASTLDPTGKAQRFDVSALSPTAYIQLGTLAGKRPGVSVGQVATISCYMRATSGLLMVIYIQFIDAAGVAISTFPVTMISNGSWQRPSVTATAPANTVSANILFRVLSSSQSAGFFELDRAQLEISPVVTGWRDSGKVSTSDITVQAAATAALTSTVTQQGATLTSLSSQVTSLSNTVNSATDGLATKASSTALTALTSRVTAAETGITSTSASIVTLSNNLAAAGGDNLLPNSSFEQLSPDGTRPLWWRSDASAGAAITLSQVDSPLTSSIKALRCAATALANGGYIGPTFNTADGERPKVVAGQSYTLSTYARLSSPSARFTMYVQWIDAASALISTTQLPEVVAGTTFTRFSWTATAPAGAVRTQIFPGRLINRAGVAADMWIELDNIQFQEGSVATAYAPSVAQGDLAQSLALSSLTSTVTQQGTNLTAQTARIDTLSSTVGTVQAAAQTESTTRANADSALSTRVDGVQATAGTASANAQTALTASANLRGEVSAQWDVKLMTHSSGQKVMAGFGVGIETENGVTQSTFAVSADRFVVLNSSLSGSFTSPFAVVGGQVFINDALINKATIVNALIGQGINSATQTSYGQPVMSTDYAAGQITIQNKTTQGKYMILREDGMFMVSGGVVMLELAM
jgi:predicted phage tail protein